MIDTIISFIAMFLQNENSKYVDNLTKLMDFSIFVQVTEPLIDIVCVFGQYPLEHCYKGYGIIVQWSRALCSPGGIGLRHLCVFPLLQLA